MRIKVAVSIALALTLVLSLEGAAQAVIPVRTRLTMIVTPTHTTPGGTVIVSGTLSAPLNPRRAGCFRGRKVGVFRNGRFLGAAITDASGHYSFPVRVFANSVIYTLFKGFSYMQHPNRVVCQFSRGPHINVSVSVSHLAGRRLPA